MKTVALCITHAAHIPARKKSMARLREQLRLGDILDIDADDTKVTGNIVVPNFGRIPYREETIRAPHHVWSRRQWDWGGSLDAGLVLFLQDDVVVAPDFWQRLESFLYSGAYCDGQWVNLLTNHHGAREAFLEGYTAYSTTDGLNGVGYGANPENLRGLGEWIDTRILPGVNEKISDDVLPSLFCMAHDRRIVTPLPGLLDHDLSTGTLHPHEHGANRRAYVRWDDEDRRSPPGQHPIAELNPSVAHLGRFFATAHTMLPGVLLDSVEGARIANRLEAEACPWPYNRFFENIIAQENWPE